jgi:hypothetical protein
MTKEAELKETEPNRLTRKQIEAIPHLIGAKSLEEGRKRARVGKATLYCWLKSENFRDALATQREELISEALGRLKSSVTFAVSGLVELMGAEEKPVRLRACEKILDFFLKTKEIDELEKRLERIEKVVSERRVKQ